MEANYTKQPRTNKKNTTTKAYIFLGVPLALLASRCDKQEEHYNVVPFDKPVELCLATPTNKKNTTTYLLGATIGLLATLILGARQTRRTLQHVPNAYTHRRPSLGAGI